MGDVHWSSAVGFPEGSTVYLYEVQVTQETTHYIQWLWLWTMLSGQLVESVEFQNVDFMAFTGIKLLKHEIGIEIIQM